MAKEFEAGGMPVAYLTTLDGLARSVGAPRIVRGKAITNVAGDPNLRPSDERALRKELINKALTTQVNEPTTFD
jgi:betaine reductase